MPILLCQDVQEAERLLVHNGFGGKISVCLFDG